MSAKVSLTIDSRYDELPRVAAAVEELGRSEGWPPDLLYGVTLILEELGVNIVNYGGDVGAIEISLASEEEAVTIEIRDDGSPFDPVNDAPEADTSSPLSERPIGGLGLHLVRKLADELHYRREQGKNHVALTKLRRG